MASCHRVFVYGTLKQNEPNHNWISDEGHGKAKFIGLARSVQKLPLVIASRYNIPYLLAMEGSGHNVVGELYEIDKTMLANLDVLEDHPKYYERKVKQVTVIDSGETVEAWMYLLHRFKPFMLELPFLESYESEGSHGLTYVKRYLRPDCDGSTYWTDVKQDDKMLGS